MKYLYVTWDSPQANYLESLFLPILKGLADFGIRFEILQFTWGDRSKVESTRAICSTAGIAYTPVRVRRGWAGLGAFAGALLGSRHVLHHMGASKADAVLARSIMPALATMRAARSARFPIVFDADGLPLDERVEFAERDPGGPTHRLLRDAEAQMVRRSAAVMVRTKAALEILLARGGAGVVREKFHVVTNGRDPNVFTPLSAGARRALRTQLGLAEDPVVVYSGSVGGGKYLLDDMLLFFDELRRLRPGAAFLILSPDQILVREALDRPAFAGIRSQCLVETVPPAEVPSRIALADAGLAAIAPTMSMLAAAPIKTAEYLLCGLPVIGTAEVGDNDAAIEAGVFYPIDFRNETGRRAGAQWLASQAIPAREEIAVRARIVGLENFSLEASIEQYRMALLQ